MRARRIAATLASAVATGGATMTLLAAGWSSAGAAGPQAPALPTPPIPTPTISLPIPTLTPLPTLPPLPTPTIPPLPTPTIPPLPSLPLPTPTGLLPLPPTPSSGGIPVPLPSGVPGGGSGGGPSGGGSGPPGAPWLPQGGGPSSGNAATGIGSPMSSSSTVLGQLLSLLGTPPNVGIEQPSLEHFGLPIGSTLAGLPTSHHATGGSAATGALVIVCSLLAALGIGFLGVRGTRGWSRPVGAAALPAALVLGLFAIGIAGATTASPASTPASAKVAAPTGSATVASRQVTAAGQGVFAKVASLESTIVHQADAVQWYGILAQGQQPGVADLTPGHGTGGSPTTLAAEQRSAAVSLQTTLQQEYSTFAAIAASPDQSSALMQAASAQPAAVRNAISYDLQAVQAALAQQQAIAQAASAASVPGLTPTTVGLPAGAPHLTYPVVAPITQGFGPSPLAFEPAFRVAGVTYPHFHTGLDIAGPFGTPVGAAAAGVVALAGSETDGQGHLVGYGNYVVIANGGGLITLYGHLDRLLVRPGQAVLAGQPIGLEGSSGNSTGPHLHFEVRQDGTPVDPLLYL